MVFYPSENSPNKAGGNNPNLPAFDLQSEKQRIEEGTEEIRQELLAAWQKKYATAQIFPAKLSSANPELIEFLLSFKNTLFYNDLAKKFGFSPEQRDSLPQIIWSVSLAKNWYGLENLLQSEMKINPSTAGQMAILLNQNILFKAKELGEKVPAPKKFVAEKVESGVDKITIQEALRRYPELGEQLITSERIVLTSFPAPVRPSIKNWLADYNFLMGYDQERSGIERTTYLFHNKNTQNLSPFEREKLSQILKSYDENYPLTVNKNTKQLVFSQVPPRVSKRVPAQVEVSASRPTPHPIPQPVYQPAERPLPNPAAQPITRPVQTPVSQPPTQPTPRPVIQPAPRPPVPAIKPVFRTTQPARPSAPLPQGKLEIKEAPHAPKKEDGHVRFSSAHTLPVEKNKKDSLQPYRITPFGANPEENTPEGDAASIKNIINLKE